MKTKLLLLIVLLGLKTIAQNEVKHQTEQLSLIKKGDYIGYLTQQDGSGKYEGGLDELTYKLTNFQDYRIQPGAHKEVYMIFGGNPDRPDKYKETMFLPDNEAFPITYVEKVFEGNKEMQDELGFAPRINRLTDGNRLVFLDGRIYVIEDWESKDSYNLVSVMEHQTKKMGGLKKMKEVMRSPKKMKEMQPHETLKKYLDNAYEKQQTVYAQWMKNPKNAAIVENTESIRKLTIDAINKQRADWRNSDAYRRIKERNQSFAQSASQSQVTITNRTGKDIYIYEEGSSNGSRISVNGKGTYNCKKNQYYSFSGNSSAAKSTQISTANQSCGQEKTIQ
ncbi:hypothetical protein Q4Q39_16900 [Flavivirga amylovorans]|uniref:Uncharacterized protein n=1 Tax=Flavivirga amylovorans TaxID=870486 RepID=A0ABT8X517_9FLAO|nr:hypothetical protein [Flavivirga amylovorans]MDO5989085.1 hypothetical protein [Flavivirga amylovorans]